MTFILIYFVCAAITMGVSIYCDLHSGKDADHLNAAACGVMWPLIWIMALVLAVLFCVCGVPKKYKEKR
jgi:hypothetical protein